MHRNITASRRFCALAPAAALLLLALCLLAVGAQALTDSPALVINEPGRYTLDHDLSSDSSIGVLITSSDVVFDGMGHSIAGTDANGSMGINATGPPFTPITNVTIRNLTVRNWSDGVRVGMVSGLVVEDVVAEQNGVGLVLNPTSGITTGNTIRDSVFRDNTGAGISLDYPTQGIAVERCQATRNGDGLVTFDSGGFDIAANRIDSSDFSGNTGAGLSIDGGHFSEISDSTIRGNGGDGLTISASYTNITGNQIENNGGAGVRASDRSHSDITGNRIAGNGIGVLSSSDHPCTIWNNVLNNTDNGFFPNTAPAFTLTHPKTAGPNIVGGPDIGGNFWAFPNGTGFSQTHPDANHDGFCDEPFVSVDGATDYLPLAVWTGPANGSTPFKPLSVPGRIQAEDYDLGGEGVAYHDTTPGNSGGAYRHDDVDIETQGGVTDVGWIRNGEYLTYTVNVTQNGTSTMTASVASPNSGRTMDLLVDGSAVATIAVPNTGSFATFRTVEVPVMLAAGTHTLKLTFQGDGQNLDWIEFAAPTQTPCGFADAYPRPNFTADRTSGTAPLTVRFTDTSSEFAYDWNWSFGAGAGSTEQNPVHTFLSPGVYPVSLTIKEHDHWSGCVWVHYWNDPTNPLSTRTVNVTVEGTGPATGLAIPGTIQAEDYNLGGEGVAYHDTTPGNEGGAYRHDDVDIEVGGSGYDVGWIRNGEYLTYTVNVTQTGTYAVTARTASPNSGRAVTLWVDGVQKTAVTIPNTGSFDTYRDISLTSSFVTATVTPSGTGGGFVEAPIPLEAGTHTLKLSFTGDGQNLDWISFGQGSVTPPPTTPAAGGASFTAAPLTAPHGTAVKFTVTPASGKSISAAWWSFDAPAHLNTWNSRATNPTFFYPSAGTFSPLVKLTYTDGSTETVQRTNYVRAT
jgi:hypothetical protein